MRAYEYTRRPRASLSIVRLRYRTVNLGETRDARSAGLPCTGVPERETGHIRPRGSLSGRNFEHIPKMSVRACFILGNSFWRACGRYTEYHKIKIVWKHPFRRGEPAGGCDTKPEYGQPPSRAHLWCYHWCYHCRIGPPEWRPLPYGQIAQLLSHPKRASAVTLIAFALGGVGSATHSTGAHTTQRKIYK